MIQRAGTPRQHLSAKITARTARRSRGRRKPRSLVQFSAGSRLRYRQPAPPLLRRKVAREEYRLRRGISTLARKTIGKIWRDPRRMVRPTLNGPRGTAPLDVSVDSPLQRKAIAMAETGAFLGGPPAHYHAIDATSSSRFSKRASCRSTAFWISVADVFVGGIG
jgi:hypothetical protein